MLEKVILPSREPVEYRYDGAGRLTGRKTADSEDLFVQTGWDIVEKRSVGQSPQGAGWQGQDSQGQDRHSQYPQGADWQGQDSQGQNREGGRTYYTGLSSIKEGDKVRYYLYNHRGDTVLVTGGDGEIIHNLSYEAYGKATDKLGYPAGSVNIETGGGSGSGGSGTGESFGGGAGASSGGASSSGATSGGAGSGESFGSGGRGSVFPQLFAGAYGIRYDAKTNLHYMRYRWYSQTQMRFISLDLIRNANRYSYTNGNPIMYVDPTGLEPEEVKIHVRINDVADAYYQPQKMPSNKRYNDEFGNFSEEIYMDKQKNIKIRLEDGTYVYQKDFGYIIDDTIDNPSNCHGLVQGGTLKLEISTNPKEKNGITESEKIFNTPSYKRIIYNSYNYGGLHSLLSLILFPITIPKPESFKPGDVLYWGGHSSMVYSVNNGNVMMIDKNGDDGLIWLIKLKWLTNYAYGPEFKHYRPTGIPLKVVFNLPMGSYTVYIHPHQLLLNRYERDCK